MMSPATIRSVSVSLSQLVIDFATGIEAADAQAPQAVNQRSKLAFQPGIGPHSEITTVELVMTELARVAPGRYPSFRIGVPYADRSRQKCDLALGDGSPWHWLIEVKMVRMLGDNAKQNDNLPTHILSPYAAHRSALTDCAKLASSGLKGPKAILMYGYEAAKWPLEPLVSAFETLATRAIGLGPRESATFDGLIHPVHKSGAVFAWEILSRDQSFDAGSRATQVEPNVTRDLG